jgi:hypothetical protein
VLITLTDKDWAEINACLAEYPDAKHQLCFWHVLRAATLALLFCVEHLRIMLPSWQMPSLIGLT